MKIFVTGGGGYLGSILVPKLLENGYHVTVLDNFIHRQNSLASVCSYSSFKIVHGDTRDERIIEKLVQKADIVIPLAAIVGAPACDRDPLSTQTINVGAISTILGYLSPQQRILIPTSNSGYGLQKPGVVCTENMPLTPTSLYGKTKAVAEEMVMERENFISFRLATVFGMSPRMRLDLLVNDFVYRAVHDRTITLFEADFIRNYIHIQDVARVFLHCIKNFDDLKGQIYNVGLSNANLSKWEVCNKITVQLPYFHYTKIEFKKDPDQRNYIVSNDKIEATGFKTAYSLDDGIRELIKGCTMLQNTRYGNI